MATLLSSAFGRKNLLGVGRSDSRATPSPSATTFAERAQQPSDAAPAGSNANTNKSNSGAPLAAPSAPNFAAPSAAAGAFADKPLGISVQAPLWSPSNVDRGAAYDVRDPVSMHLLMENALEDSRGYAVLASNDVQAARAELDAVAARIEAAQRKLRLEQKVRDAAKHLNAPDKIDEANQATLRCDQLQDELVLLQRDEHALQRRLLEHTAGVLQMTHKGYIKDAAEEARAAAPAAGTFDTSHFYEPSMLLEALDRGGSGGAGGSGGSKLSEEQQNMIGTIQRRVEDLNGRIRGLLREFDAPAREIPVAPSTTNDSEQVIETTLEYVNSLDQCFALVQRLQTSQKRELGQTKEQWNSEKQRIDSLQQELAAKQQELAARQQESATKQKEWDARQQQWDMQQQDWNAQKTQWTSTRGKAEDASREAMQATAQKLGEVNQRIHDTIAKSSNGAASSNVRAPPAAAGSTFDAQLQYLDVVHQSYQSQSEQLEKHDSTNRSLWQMLANPQEDGEYTLTQFASKVQEMNIRFSSLQEQKNVLTRQIQQQREAVESGDSARQVEVADLKEQLERAQEELATTERDMDAQIEKLTSTIDDLEASKATLAAEYAEVGAGTASELESERKSRRDAEEQLRTVRAEVETQAQRAAQDADDQLQKSRKEADETLQKVRKEGQEALQKAWADTEDQVQKARQESEQQIQRSEDQLQKARKDLEKAQTQLTESKELAEINTLAISADIEAKTKAVETAEAKAGELEGEVVRLQTELTMTRAELDGAYGTRAQRAKERDPEMQERVKQLERELQETVTDYESMMKATIEHEKEKDQFESLVDSLRDQVEALESELNEERVNSMGGKSDGGAGGSTSAAVLRNEFRKMMKDAREQHSKTLKTEKEERRKLEAQVRQLKRDALPSRGKGSGSPVPA